MLLKAINKKKPVVAKLNPHLFGCIPAKCLTLISQLQLWQLDVGNEEQAAVELPPHSLMIEKLLEVITHAVTMFSLDWPYGRLAFCLLPACRCLPFFAEVHTKGLRLWNGPYSACLFSPATADFSAIVALDEHG